MVAIFGVSGAKTMKTALVLLMALAALPGWGDDMAGHYVLRGVMEVGSELWLKPDGSFEYMLAYGAADYWAKGTWRQEGNAVILQSTAKEEAPFRLVRSETGKPGRIRVWVMGKNGKGVEHIRVVLLTAGKPEEATTDSDGAAVFADAAGAHDVSFEVRVYSLQAGPYKIDPSKKDFYFEINGDAIQLVFFKNEPLAIEGKNLVMTHWKEGPPMHYEKE
jgi:hypothetical protein